jgi:diguanylate cyclase (GGDEF)-like protein
MRKQTDRSLAAAAFYFAGGLFPLLNATVFKLVDGPRYDLLLIATLCFGCSFGILLAGERFSKAAAGAVMCLPLITVVPNVLLSSHELRVFSSGFFFFFPYFIFLVWFLPTWFARLLGYSWLALFCMIVVLRYGTDPLSGLLMLVVSGAVLGELVGRFKQRIEREAVTDPLCRVWNRRGFESLLSKAVATAERNERPLALVYLDLDDFKAINDGRGHIVGDQTLRDFAREVDLQIRTEDVFARFGGDEFALLLIDSDAEQALETAERLRREIPDPAWSFGISEWQPGEKPRDFISRADLRMFDDKQRRKKAAVDSVP